MVYLLYQEDGAKAKKARQWMKASFETWATNCNKFYKDSKRIEPLPEFAAFFCQP